jgi:hypothetical protein
MERFLKDREILESVREIVSGSDFSDLAVAYWGKNAAEGIGLDAAVGTVRVICDAWSGACNPDELRKLYNHPNVQLRSLDNLHSKVYLTSKGAVVGSANASNLGLQYEPNGSGNHEAAVRLASPDHCAEIQAWFESKWRDAYSLTMIDIDSLPDPGPIERPPHTERSIVDVLETEPGWFIKNPVRLFVYESEDGAPTAHDSYLAFAGTVCGKATAEEFKERRIFPYFEVSDGWKVSESEAFICFGYSRDASSPSWDGIWAQGGEKPRTLTNGVQILLLSERNRVNGLRIAETDKAQIAERIEVYIKHDGWAQDQHGALIDMDLAAFWKNPLLEDPWFESLDPTAREKIVHFASIREHINGTVCEIYVGTTGEGKQPNFRLKFPGGDEDYDGATYNPTSKEFKPKHGINNPKNLARLLIRKLT